MKHPGSRAVFERLVAKADMLVENFSRGVLERLGAGYADVHRMNSRLLYCSITGFGSQGEGSGKAMDAIIQALSGVMMTSGAAGDPPVRVGVPFADLCTPLFGVIGLLAALHQSQRTGMGQHIDVSMLGVMTSMVASEPFDLLERCGVPQRTGQTVPRLAPFGVYATANGYVAICAPTEAFASSLFHAIGRPELCEDERFRTRDVRVQNVAEVDREEGRREQDADPVAQRPHRRRGAPDREVGLPLPHRREEPEPLDVVEVQMRQEDVHVLRQTAVEVPAELPDPRARVEDEQGVVVGPQRHAGRVPAVAHRGRPGRGHGAAAAPDPERQHYRGQKMAMTPIGSVALASRGIAVTSIVRRTSSRPTIWRVPWAGRSARNAVAIGI